MSALSTRPTPPWVFAPLMLPFGAAGLGMLLAIVAYTRRRVPVGSPSRAGRLSGFRGAANAGMQSLT